jgi:hypothetical protein
MKQEQPVADKHQFAASSAARKQLPTHPKY